MRDMTRKQFVEALKRNGMSLELACMGYVALNAPGITVSVSYFNAPNRTWRGALSFLLSEKARYEKAHSDRHTGGAA
jgi:hypothetical protein